MDFGEKNKTHLGATSTSLRKQGEKLFFQNSARKRMIQ